MDKSIVLAIIGLTATIILGIWGVYLALKHRYPGRLTFIEVNCIDLFDSIVRNLPDLSIQYKNNPIGESLVMLKGILINVGWIDISDSMIEEPLTLDLPKGYRWLTAKVVSTSPKVRAKIEVSDDSRLVFDVGLFRCKEHIRFEALAEVPVDQKQSKEQGDRLKNALQFAHRITNTQKVKTKHIPNYTKFPYIKFLLFLIIFMVLAFPALFYWGRTNDGFNYLLKTDDNRIIEVQAFPKSDGTTEIRGVNEKFYKRVPNSDFVLMIEWEPKVISTGHFFLFPIIIILSLIGLTSLLFILLPYIQIKKINKLL